jgi:hypothetical protein
MEEPFDIPSWFAPGVGNVLPVQCDPRKGKAKFDMTRLKAARKAQASAAKSEQIAEFDAASRAAPGTPVPAPLGDPRAIVLGGQSGGGGDVSAAIAAALQQVGASAELAKVRRQQPVSQQPDGGDSLDRLQQLADLHDAGALTDAEFAAAKARILGGS